MKKDSRALYRAQSFEHLRGLRGISDSQLSEHLELYAGYVKQVNALMQELAEMRSERRSSGKDLGLATERVKYVDAFLKNVDCSIVDRRYAEHAELRSPAV